MIYEDIHKYLMKNASSKEIDIILNIVNNVDWNSNINVDFYQLANLSGTTTRYVRDVFKKMSSSINRNNILSYNNPTKTYKFLLGKSSVLHNKGDKYGKKYKFLYSNNFQSLNIYSKRILLETVMVNSTSEQNKIYLNVDKFIHKNEINSGLIPSRKVLINSINQINKLFDGGINVSLTTRLLRRQEMIVVNFKDDKLLESFNNFTERKILRESLFSYGFFEYLSDDHCIAIEKVGKYIYNSLNKITKEHSKNRDLNFDQYTEAFDTARFIYNSSLEKLANHLIKQEFTYKDPEELSAYFSAVVFSVVAEEMAKSNQRYESMLSIYESFSDNNSFHSREFSLIKFTSDTLKKWCTDWILVRGRKKKAKNHQLFKQNIESLNNLQNYLEDSLEIIEQKIFKYGNNILNSSTNKWSHFKEDALDFIQIQKENSSVPFYIN